ncbi:MAG: glycerol-3-phosphate 1-O-acyltransferase PlsY [Proteobacteria bacterium]|nr:glycerol-3-phosphate 1-O-acyltransferase PlsY [Pseudomonadota bacterium]
MTDGPLSLLALAALGYLLGSIPFGLLLTKAAGLGDIRNVGSGNIGATNVLRTGKKGLAAATLLLDALKGLVAVLVARAMGGQPAALVAGLFAVIGHLFPVWLGFKGGKGVATGLGVLIAASWPVGIGACVAWLLVAKIGRFSSLAALTAFASTPILAALLGDLALVELTLVVALLVFIRHHANIRRLLAGTEPRIGQGKVEAT